MKKPAKSIILIIFLVIPSLNSFSDNNTKIDFRIDRARDLLAKNDFIGASILAKEVIDTSDKKPDIALAHKIKGDIFVLLSEKEFNEGITRNIINIIDFAGFFINSLYLWKIPIAFMILPAPFT